MESTLSLRINFQTKAAEDLKGITISLQRMRIMARSFSKIVMASKTTGNTRLDFEKIYAVL